MALLPKRSWRSLRNLAVACVAAFLIVLYYLYWQKRTTELDMVIARRLVERNIEEALKSDKGMGCLMPELDPFSKEVMQFVMKSPFIKCDGQDWVKCYHSKCRVVDAIKDTVEVTTCTYKDIIYHNDQKYSIGLPTRVERDGIYELKESDHVKVACVGTLRHNGHRVRWSGNTLGLRPVPVAPSLRRSCDLVILSFDSTARNGFIRKMPKSWRMLKEIGATVMEGYNVVGDGTPAALFPILTGRTELELPDVRKRRHNNASLDSFPFIFYKLKQDGLEAYDRNQNFGANLDVQEDRSYVCPPSDTFRDINADSPIPNISKHEIQEYFQRYRTAYFEDTPDVGTFQYRFTGFRQQPTDHYLRALLMENRPSKLSLSSWFKGGTVQYCLGDTPQYRVMLNMTEQFLDLGGKLFIFTFIADISHDDFNMIENADDDTAAFLHRLHSRAEDTLIVVMGDHGPRYAKVRSTLQGKLEERLPLLAIRLPEQLVRARRHAARALAGNAHALCTPHDLHATILDALDMRQHWNPYRVPGASFARGLSLLEPIPGNRSCSEAGIEPHWCACLVWQRVFPDDPLYEKPAHALVDYINSLVATAGGRCETRTLISASWVLRQRADSRLLAVTKAMDSNGYVGHFDGHTTVEYENYQIKIGVGPGYGTFEATMRYIVNEDKFVINTRDISRTNAYGHESDCISETHPHLSPYCYCC